ncbi:MAG TPA: hypothetical protein VE134_09070 [Methanomicrobiales archaeon]|nr:hypothetical protein [Methanomicrobiales archaeon]
MGGHIVALMQKYLAPAAFAIWLLALGAMTVLTGTIYPDILFSLGFIGLLVITDLSQSTGEKTLFLRFSRPLIAIGLVVFVAMVAFQVQHLLITQVVRV